MKKQAILLVLIAALLSASPATAIPVPDPFIMMYGHSDDVGATATMQAIIPPFSVIEGTSTNTTFINELRAAGKVYAYNRYRHPLADADPTVQELYDYWRAPFHDTNGGPNGYDAIAIDELRTADTDGTSRSNTAVGALQMLRTNYPNKGIYVAATWNYGDSPANYSDQLNAVNTYADMLVQEVYIHESNLSYGWLGLHGAAYAPKLNAEVPGILNKTVYGLYISQGGFVADNNTSIGYWGHLDEQFHRIRNDASASTMPGVMAWVYSRSEKNVTPDYFARLVDHYYTQGNTSYFGDGNTNQLISNAQLSTLTGVTTTVGTGGDVGLFNYSSVPGLDTDHDSSGQASHGSNGLKMTRGSTPNTASLQVSGLDTTMYYTVSAWVGVPDATPAGQHAKLTITESDGTYIDSQEIDNIGDPIDGYTKWDNDWSRIIFNFLPTSSTVNIVLSDETTTPGQTLYWDFIELEEAYRFVALPGDVTGDGWVGGADLTTVITNWGMTGADREDGDLSGDGTVSGPDYTEVITYWGTGTPPSEPPSDIPEPATLALLSIASLVVLRRRT